MISGKIEGELRISVSSDLGRNVIIPWIDEFMEMHPGLTLKAHLSDSNVDFYRDSVDMAVRYGSPTDAHLYGFKIADIPRALCATPTYLKQHGIPTHPNDLIHHNGLHFQLSDMVHDTWRFTETNGNKETEYKVKLKSNRTANDGDLVRRWCVKGYGFSSKSILDMSDDLLAGRVVHVMPEFTLVSTEMWFVCPSRQSITPAMRLLRDHFRTKVEQRLKSFGIIRSYRLNHKI